MRRANGTAAEAASHACEYLPMCAVCTDCKAAKTMRRRTAQDAVSTVEEVGVADELLGFWQKMASNYPSLLSRIDAEKSQYGPEPEA